MASASRRVRFHAPRGLPRPPRVWAIGPEGHRLDLKIHPAEREGDYLADFSPTGSGTYEVSAMDGESDRDRMWVEVASDWKESDDTRPNFARLEALARMSGGRFVSVDNLTGKIVRSIFAQLFWEKRAQTVAAEIFFVALAICALLAEWIFRRRNGLP